MANQHLAFKDSWEQARLISYIIAQTNSKKKLKLTDIISFNWDNEEAPNTSISNEDIDRLSNKAKDFENLFN